MKRLLRSPLAHLGLFALVVASDQLTKWWAVASMGVIERGNGLTYPLGPVRVAGDWLWWFLAYNPGAAFSLAPQKILPFLDPTVFYALLTLIASAGLVALYRRLGPARISARLGSAAILGGAIGNLIDRLRIDHVVDFISVGIPGFSWRWPTFNIADSAICVGVALILLADWLDHALFDIAPPDSAAPAEAAPSEATPNAEDAGTVPQDDDTAACAAEPPGATEAPDSAASKEIRP